MIPHLVYYQLVILGLLWLCVMLLHLWPSPPRGMSTRPVDPSKPKRKRSSEPKPFAGLTQPPLCTVGATDHGKGSSPSAMARSHAANEPPSPYRGHFNALLSPYRL